MTIVNSAVTKDQSLTISSSYVTFHEILTLIVTEQKKNFMPELIYSTKQKSILLMLLIFSLTSFATLSYLDSKGTFDNRIHDQSEMELQRDMTGKLLHVPAILETLESLIKRV